MADPLLVNILTSIQQALCCIANKVTAPASATIVVTQQTLTPATSDEFTGTFANANTSIEIENFATSDWLRLSADFAPGDFFWIPPGGSKVIATSAPTMSGSYTIQVFDTFGGTAGVSETVNIQITEIYQP